MRDDAANCALVHPARRAPMRAGRAGVAALLILAACAVGQPCGDCNGDGAVDILDALRAAQHTVLILSVTSPQYEVCNVHGDLGGPTAPGSPVINVLDALAIAQFVAGLVGSIPCAPTPPVSPGPFDLLISAPAETASDQRFTATVTILAQGTMTPVVPQNPLLVRVQMASGAGTILGSTRQWMRAATMDFCNLRHGALGIYTLRATAGAPHGIGLSSAINSVVAVEIDHEGGVQIAPGPYADVRFHLRASGVLATRTGATFEWEVSDESMGLVIDSGSRVLGGETMIDVSSAAISGGGLYRVTARINGSVARADYPLYIGSSSADHVVTLTSGRVGVPYSQSLAAHVGGAFTDFKALAVQIPAGLVLAPGAAGILAGTPMCPGMHRITFFGIAPGNVITRISAHVAVFSESDTDSEPNIDFSNMGPLAVSMFDLPAAGSVSFFNPWSCAMDSTRVRFYYPTNIQNLRRLPAISFIHGNGFRYDYYNSIMTVIASYGYIVGSCDNPSYPGGTCMPCGGGAAPSGWGRATGFQLFVRDQMLVFDADPTSPLYRHVDADNIIWAGHSRGGATALLNTKLRAEMVRGCITYMPVDPKRDVCLALSDDFPPVPLLNLSGERDQDEAFPASENFMEDAVLTGADTHVTIYGGNHNFTSDSVGAEGGSNPTITRTAQHQIIRHWTVAFLERHTRGDLRLEGQLYLGERTSATDVAVFGSRDMAGTVVVDDHNVAPESVNNLGGANTWMTVGVSDTNSYPIYMTNRRVFAHRRFTFSAGAGFNLCSAPAGAPIDATACENLVFRARQYDSTTVGATGSNNWQSWITTFAVTIVDAAGQNASINLAPVMPVSGVPSPAQQRFHRFVVPISAFVAQNPALDRAQLMSVRLNIGPAGTSTRFFAIDDLRVE